MAVRIGIQDRQRFFRDGLAMVIDGEPDLEVVGVAATAGDLRRTCELERPDVVLLEIDAPDWDGCRLAAALRRVVGTLRIVGLAGSVDRALALRAYQAGVRTVVTRDSGVATVLAAIRSRAAPVPVVTSMTSHVSAMSTAHPSLTARELDVLRLVGAGLTTREVSVRLGISPKTVENHKQRIFTKLGVQNQAHAVAVAMRTGVLAPGAGLRALGC